MPRKDIAGTDKGSQMQGWTPPSFPKPFHLKCNALGEDLGSVVRLDLNDGASEEITIGAAGLGPALQYNKLGGRYTTMLYDAVANEWNMWVLECRYAATIAIRNACDHEGNSLSNLNLVIRNREGTPQRDESNCNAGTRLAHHSNANCRRLA